MMEGIMTIEINDKKKEKLSAKMVHGNDTYIDPGKEKCNLCWKVMIKVKYYKKL
jgi:hypothetical protein